MKMDGRDSAECKNWEKMDKIVILEFVLNEEKTKYGIVLLLQSKCKKENVKNQGRTSNRIQFVFFREGLPSLYKYGRSDRRQSSGQEGKLLYAERATRGHRICEFLTNSER